MRAYIRIFLNLLMPISLIITMGATLYFSLNYDFSKAVKLGFLVGVLSGFPLSLVTAFFFHIKKRNSPAKQESDPVDENTAINTSSSNSRTQVEQKLMLLMDKNLAFDVALFSITDQNLGEVTTKKSQEKNTITLHTYDETIQIITSALTRHTAQLLIKGSKNSQELSKIISYIKEKEHSFLQY